MNRTDRLTGILLALQRGRQTAAQLAERFEVSRRTILRDVDALSQIGVPVVALPGPGGGFALPDDYWLPPLHLSTAEATLLLLAVQALGADTESPFGLARQTAEDKLRSALRPDVLAEAERELHTLGIAPPRRSPRPDHFWLLRESIRRANWLRVEYQSLRRVAEHHLFPVRLHVQGGHWYCRAISLEAREERSFRLDRMVRVDPVAPPLGADEARRDAALPQRDYQDPAHPEVVVRLTYLGLRLAEDAFPEVDHPRQLDAESWELRFRCPPSELPFYAREFFAMGPAAEVLAPAELRAQVRDLAAETMSHYEHAEKR